MPRVTSWLVTKAILFDLAHIYMLVEAMYENIATNVKVTFLSIKTICRALSLLVLKILAVY